MLFSFKFKARLKVDVLAKGVAAVQKLAAQK